MRVCPLTEPASPLTTTDPNALTAMFEADPLTLSDAAYMALIIEMRRRRNVHLAEEAAKALKPKASRAKAEPTSAGLAAARDTPITEINLDDL